MHFGTFGGLAQLGERLTGSQEVSGSIPLFSTNSNECNKKLTSFRSEFFVLCCGRENACVETSYLKDDIRMAAACHDSSCKNTIDVLTVCLRWEYSNIRTIHLIRS